MKPIIDIDGNVYKTIRVGPQIWTAENLNVTHFLNGDPISDHIDGVFWDKLFSGAFCDYDNNPENSILYGKLYNWHAVSDERCIAPQGWHVPNDKEWNILFERMERRIGNEKIINPTYKNFDNVQQLSNFEMGFKSRAGGYNCSSGIRHWESGYSPDYKVSFFDIGKICYWWTSFQDPISTDVIAISRNLEDFSFGENIFFHCPKWRGLSVRCIKDNSEAEGQTKNKNVQFINENASESVTDIDGNIYKIIRIGSQVWMAENLKVTHYQNGDPINFHKDSEIYKENKPISYCLKYENISTNGTIYGKLYNWHAISDKRKIAPKGWHIPSKFDWKILFFILGGKNRAGGKLKELNTEHWHEPNAGATNDIGFTALPAGNFEIYNGFRSIGHEGHWWCSTEKIKKYEKYEKEMSGLLSNHYRYHYYIDYRHTKVNSRRCQQDNAFSVRLVKDFSFVSFVAYLVKGITRVIFPRLFSKGIYVEKPEIEWVIIPSGTFTSKNPLKDGNEVRMQSFKMSKYAITFEQYDIFCNETGRKKPTDCGWGRGKRPVIAVRWKDANAFADWLGCRLPTLVEWEYACRAGTNTKFNTGDEIDRSQANFYVNVSYSYRSNMTLPVGTYEPNQWGLFDMHGNVDEWVSPCSSSQPHIPFDKYSYHNSYRNSNIRLVMGGSWQSLKEECRSWKYKMMLDDSSNCDVGFRLVLLD